MIKNYLKIAARSLQKRPAFTAINLLGLAIGLPGSIRSRACATNRNHGGAAEIVGAQRF